MSSRQERSSWRNLTMPVNWQRRRKERFRHMQRTVPTSATNGQPYKLRRKYSSALKFAPASSNNPVKNAQNIMLTEMANGP